MIDTHLIVISFLDILTCLQVLWFKDTAQLGITEQHASHARGNRYTLIIRNVTAADFGNYR